MTNEKEVIEYLKSRYTYDAAKGEIRNRKGQMVCDQLFRYVGYLESVQQMPLVLRLRYFRCVLSVYDFLRKQKQLGRREGPFSDEVRYAIIKSLNAKINCSSFAC